MAKAANYNDDQKEDIDNKKLDFIYDTNDKFLKFTYKKELHNKLLHYIKDCENLVINIIHDQKYTKIPFTTGNKENPLPGAYTILKENGKIKEIGVNCGDATLAKNIKNTFKKFGNLGNDNCKYFNNSSIYFNKNLVKFISFQMTWDSEKGFTLLHLKKKHIDKIEYKFKQQYAENVIKVNDDEITFLNSTKKCPQGSNLVTAFKKKGTDYKALKAIELKLSSSIADHLYKILKNYSPLDKISNEPNIFSKDSNLTLKRDNVKGKNFKGDNDITGILINFNNVIDETERRLSDDETSLSGDNMDLTE